jgi:hypothetical protein
MNCFVAKSKYHKEFNGFEIFVGLLNTLNFLILLLTVAP